MSLPVTLPDPPEIFQSASRCWAAAYISWNKAQIGAGADAAFPSSAHLEEFIDSIETRADDPTTTRNERVGYYTVNRGAINDRGLRFLSLFGMMSFRKYKPGQINPGMIGKILKRSGYIYCVYKSARRGHAVVIYGASKGQFKIMDPLQGLKSVPISAITGSGNLVIFLGVPLIPRVSAEMTADMDRLSNIPFRKPTIPVNAVRR